MPRPVDGEARYISGLDGLRALAVLAVIAYHLNLGWAPGGLLGVAVFFVLSGYLITDLLLMQRERTGRISLSRFWLRRARRLLPALWVMLAVVALWVTVAQPAQLAALRQDVVAAFLYASNWWYVFHHVSYFAGFGPPSPLGHLWSLAVEEQFYLLWPLLLIVAVRFVRSRRVLMVLVLIAIAASSSAMAAVYQPGVDPSRVYYGTDTRAFELLIGAALALMWPSRHAIAGLSRGHRIGLDAAGTAGLLVIAFTVAFTDQYGRFLYQGGLILVSVATAAVIAALVHPSTLLSRVIGVRPLRWIGVRSYGIYLWHYPIIILTTPLVDSGGSHLVRDGLQTAATVFIAALSWRYVEQSIRRGALAGWPARVRGVRWPFAGAAAGLWEAGAATGLVAVVIGAELAGIAPAAPMAQAVPELAASISLPAASSAVPVAPPCAGVPAVATPAPAPPPTPTPAPSTPAPAAPVRVTAVGDSVMIDVAPFLRAALPGATVDGLVSRQMYQLAGVVSRLRVEHALASRLVIELGTNGPFDEDQLVSVLRSLGPMDRIVLVNTRVPREWQADVNHDLARVAARVPQTTVVDWYAASEGMPQYFWPDGVHPDPQGSRILATLIARAANPATEPAPATATPSATSSASLDRLPLGHQFDENLPGCDRGGLPVRQRQLRRS